MIDTTTAGSNPQAANANSHVESWTPESFVIPGKIKEDPSIQEINLMDFIGKQSKMAKNLKSSKGLEWKAFGYHKPQLFPVSQSRDEIKRYLFNKATESGFKLRISSKGYDRGSWKFECPHEQCRFHFILRYDKATKQWYFNTGSGFPTHTNYCPCPPTTVENPSATGALTRYESRQNLIQGINESAEREVRDYIAAIGEENLPINDDISHDSEPLQIDIGIVVLNDYLTPTEEDFTTAPLDNFGDELDCSVDRNMEVDGEENFRINDDDLQSLRYDHAIEEIVLEEERDDLSENEVEVATDHSDNGSFNKLQLVWYKTEDTSQPDAQKEISDAIAKANISEALLLIKNPLLYLPWNKNNDYIESRWRIANIQASAGMYDLAAQVIDRCLEDLARRDDIDACKFKLRLLVVQGLILKNQRHCNLANKSLSEASNNYLTVAYVGGASPDCDEHYSTVLEYIGLIHLEKEEYDKAMDRIEQARKMHEGRRDLKAVLVSDGNIAYCEYRRGRYPNAIRRYREAIDKFKANVSDETSLSLALLNENLALAYHRNYEYTNAKHFYDISIGIRQCHRGVNEKRLQQVREFRARAEKCDSLPLQSSLTILFS